MTLDEIRACLEGDGWPVEVLATTTLRSQFRGVGKVFPFFVYVDPAFVTFAVIPFARVPENAKIAEALMTRLLRVNREINLAKFSIDDDSDVVLSVEYRLEDLDPSEVRDALDVLSFYADKYHAEIRDLSAVPAAPAIAT